MPKLRFCKTTIAIFENPADINTFHTVGDFNGDGKPDIVIAGRAGEMAWFENPGTRQTPWKKHHIDDVPFMECGGSAVALTSSGMVDVINGNDWRGDGLFWWENPGSKETSGWTKRIISTTGKCQLHDTIIGRVTGDDKLSLIFTNQENGTNVTVIPLPEDPYESPWPNQTIAARELFETNPFNSRYNGLQPEEGLAIGDIDGDGYDEFVAGTNWFKFVDGEWECYKFASGYITTKCLITDIDGDGRNEIVLSEGDPLVYGQMSGGKLAWFKPGTDITKMWDEHVIDEGLLDAHSLQGADLFGTGRMDLFVGEVGKGDGQGGFDIRPPALYIYRNLGNGAFERQLVDLGTGIHEGLLIDMDGDGRLDIVGKPLQGPEKWCIHVYYNEGVED